MIDNGIKLLVIPPGGWKFSQPIENANPFLIEGQTYGQLEAKVFDFRLANIEIIPSGTATRESVRDDIRSFICSQYPNQCTGNIQREQSVSPVTGTTYSAPITRVDDWFKVLAFSNLEWKDAASAIAASTTCSTCPQNVVWQVPCVPCVEAVHRRIARYKGDRSTPLDGQLKSCRLFGHHNELAVWLKNTFSKPKDTLPEYCWNR